MKVYIVDKEKDTRNPAVIYKAIERKEANFSGWYVDIEFPLEYKDKVNQDTLIEVDTRRGSIMFRVHNKEVLNNRVKVRARHTAFDSEYYFIEHASFEESSLQYVLGTLKKKADRVFPLEMHSVSDVVVTHTFEKVTLLEALNWLVENYNLSVKLGWNIIVLGNNVGRGIQREVIYGRDLEDIRGYEDWNSVVTKIYPYTSNGVTLPEKYVYSDVRYDKEYTSSIQFNLEEPELPEGTEWSLEAQQSQLRKLAKDYLEKNKYPVVGYQVTSDIKDDLDLYDEVLIKHPALTSRLPVTGEVTKEDIDKVGIPTTVKAYEYDVIAERVLKWEYGDLSLNINKIFTSRLDRIEDTLTSKVDSLDNRLEEQTDFILNWNKKGHMIIENDQIFFVDKLPASEAKNVMQIGLGGIAFSNNGIGGNFTSAWSLDGEFNTNYIGAGKITVSHLSSEVGSSLDITSNKAITNLVESIEEIELTPGPAGQDGKTMYNWIAYADTSEGIGISLNPYGKKYVGYAYNKDKEKPSLNPLDYQWQLVKGEDGQNGVPGRDGSSLYTWIKYADSPISGMSDNPTGKKYVGFAYNKTTPEESTKYTDYEWQLVKGEDGLNGEPGVDGKTYYNWIAYADGEKGGGISLDPKGKKYVGYAFNKERKEPSLNPLDYQWQLVKGEDGKPGQDGLPGKPGKDGKTFYTWIKYADDDKGNGMSDSSDGKTYIGLAFNKETEVESTNPKDYEWSLLPQHLTVGGRNLILNSKKELIISDIVPTGSQQLLRANAYVFESKVEQYTTYTLSIRFRGLGTNATLRPHISGTYLWGIFPVTNEFATHTATITTGRFQSDVIHLYGLNVEEIEIDWIKVERGDVATDWTPAPEDLESQLKEVEKTTIENSAGIKNLDDQVKIHAGKITNTEKGITDLDGRIRATESSLTEQASRIDVAYDKIELETSNREQDMIVMGNTINSLGQDVKEVEKGLRETNASIALVDDSVNIQASKLEEHTQTLETLEGAVESNKYLIKEQEAKINVESDRITQEVREREQSIRDVNDKINKINVVRPNLALGTDETVVLKPRIPGIINPEGISHTFRMTRDVDRDKPITISFLTEDLTGDMDTGYTFEVNLVFYNGDTMLNLQNKDSWVEYTLPSYYYSRGLREIKIINTSVHSFGIKKFKVEYGENKTDWQVAMDESFAVISEHSTKIEQNSKNIVLEARRTDQKISTLDGKKVGYNEVISSINMSPESIKIQAKNIDLRGYATFTDLSTAGSTVINGNNIRTGTISASRINFNGARGSDVNLSGTITAVAGNIGGFTIYDDRLASISKTHDFRIVLGGDSWQGDRWPIWMGKQSTNKPQYILKPGGESFQAGDAYFGANLQLAGELQTYADTTLVGGMKHRVNGRTKDFIVTLTNSGTRVHVNELIPDTASNPIVGADGDRFSTIFLRNHPNVSSDPRLKRNISELPKGVIEGIGSLEPIQFTQDGKVHYGYNAQEVENVLYKYCLARYGWENAPLAMERYAFLYKEESYLSLLYNEIQVIKDKYYMNKIKELEDKVDKLNELIERGN